MKSNFTQNDLIKKLYNELQPLEDLVLDFTLEDNWNLQEEYLAFKEVKDKLDAARYSPSKTSIAIILEHSRRSRSIETSY